jgi:hypothetical protein
LSLDKEGNGDNDRLLGKNYLRRMMCHKCNEPYRLLTEFHKLLVLRPSFSHPSIETTPP